MLLRSNFKLAAWKVCQVCVWEVMRSQSFVSSSNSFPTDLKWKLQRFKTCKWVQTLNYLTSWSIKDFKSSLSTIYLNSFLTLSSLCLEWVFTQIDQFRENMKPALCQKHKRLSSLFERCGDLKRIDKPKTGVRLSQWK